MDTVRQDMYPISKERLSVAYSKLPSEPIGWPLLPVPDDRGQLSYPTLEAGIKQGIRIILCTRPNEQLRHREYGAGLEEFLHKPNSLATRRHVHDLVQNSLERWEPRIILDRVEVREVEGQPTQIRIELSYRIKRTGGLQHLGITMKPEV